MHITPQERAALNRLPHPTRPTPVVMLVDSGFNVDDESALLVAGVDELAESLFEPTRVPIGGTTHEVIGLSQQSTGLSQPQRRADLLSGLSQESLNSGGKRAPRIDCSD